MSEYLLFRGGSYVENYKSEKLGGEILVYNVSIPLIPVVAFGCPASFSALPSPF